MSKYWTERNWKNEGDEALDRAQPLDRLQRIARESQEQQEAQIEGWLKMADDFNESDPQTRPADSEAEPDSA